MDRNDKSIFTGFPVSAQAKNHYGFEKGLFIPVGKAQISNIHTARMFAQQMNQKRDLLTYPEQTVRASQINAVALIHGITQYVFRMYINQHRPQILGEALEWLYEQSGKPTTEETLGCLVDEFPPQPVYQGEIDKATFLDGQIESRPSRQVTLEETTMLWLSNVNPAFSPFMDLFSDDPLEQRSAYNKIIGDLYQYFGKVAQMEPVNRSNFPVGENIIDFMLAPVRAAPNSLEDQLRYIIEHWSALTGGLVQRLLRGLDLINEEYKPVFGGPGPSRVPTYETVAFEAERYTTDKDWMPNLVLIAKNSYVWLDQLSRKYNRPITQLHQIPDEELDMLASWGITGLWLIGIWERSKASQTIKQLCGNPEAVASAYSLYDYRVADDLGGEAASNNLKERAWKRGIRLASDMVPNHVGIDAKWVMEHPDWFVSLPYSPFPGYTFNGPDLSRDERIGIFLEDHYYSRSDAAVVFKRVDRWTGSEQYVYHGNDGTSMPWNDTAQLNYLNSDVREAMIQTILHIARQFPIIRFDAAMTLVKKHIQRLWFPEPGHGGDIPSRSEHGMTKAQFDALMPEEFWREVVDRAAVEAPDTLLLAEAFWLLEGYFVRTLGMHRVYNSAFMIMMRDEDNQKYRLVMKNTLEFDPEVLKRYVNFMNNPDERTAIDQFGKDDKYFGVCTMLVTMPGLPMLGHGQIEGFAEKYGMEYRRAYWDERPDEHLRYRHECEIFPLARKRYLFAGVENFLLYDFYSPEGTVHEDVFAYSNRAGEERSLVVYQNRFANVRGWIKTSVPFSMRTGQGDKRETVRRTLGEGLGLSPDSNQWCIFRDHKSGLEYIRNNRELCEQGLYVELGAYQVHVFLDFRTVVDGEDRQYGRLAEFLSGRGVPSISEALQEIYVRPVLEPFHELVNSQTFRQLLALVMPKEAEAVEEKSAEILEVTSDVTEVAETTATLPAEILDKNTVLDSIEQKLVALFSAVIYFTQTQIVKTAEDKHELAITSANAVRTRLEASLSLLDEDQAIFAEVKANKTVKALDTTLATDKAMWCGLFGWLLVNSLGEISGEADAEQESRSYIDEWLLGKTLISVFYEVGLQYQDAEHSLAAIKLMTSHRVLFEGTPKEQAKRMLTELMSDSDMQQLLSVNRYNNVWWFNKEAFTQLLKWMLVAMKTAVKAAVLNNETPDEKVISARYKVIQQLQQAVDKSEYQVEKLYAALGKDKDGKDANTAAKDQKKSKPKEEPSH